MVISRNRRLRSGPARRRRWWDAPLAFGLIVVLAFAVREFTARFAKPVTLHVRVVDGDSLESGGQRLRLWGIDAPELSQTCAMPEGEITCGKNAARHLAGLIGKQAVDCRLYGKDRYGRDLADCYAGELHVNAEMVRAGQAVSYGGFEAEEDEARAAGRGLWAGIFDRPSAWRKMRGELVEPEHVDIVHFGSPLVGMWRFLKQAVGLDRP